MNKAIPDSSFILHPSSFSFGFLGGDPAADDLRLGLARRRLGGGLRLGLRDGDVDDDGVGVGQRLHVGRQVKSRTWMAAPSCSSLMLTRIDSGTRMAGHSTARVCIG